MIFRRTVIGVLFFVVAAGANPASTAVEKVREGIRYFFDGEFG